MHKLAEIELRMFVECECHHHVVFAPQALHRDTFCEKCETAVSGDAKLAKAVDGYLGMIVCFACPRCHQPVRNYLHSATGRIGNLRVLSSFLPGATCPRCGAGFGIAMVIDNGVMKFHLVDGLECQG